MMVCLRERSDSLINDELEAGSNVFVFVSVYVRDHERRFPGHAVAIDEVAGLG